MESLTLTNRDATIALGKKIGQQLVAGDVLVLDGDLGAGKTTFTKGLAAGLEIPDIIKSPTFTIIHEYQDGRLPLYHMDAYRLENGEQKTSDLKNILMVMEFQLLNGLNLWKMNCQLTF